MKTIQGLSDYQETKGTVLTIGTFDGVHVGHSKILERLVKIAKQKKLKSTLLTFFPHPRAILQKDAQIRLLNTIEEKHQKLQELGLDQMVVHPFSKEFSRLSALEYVRDILVAQLNVKTVVIGYDHRFGRNRTANLQDLMQFGSLYGFDVVEVPAQEIEEVSVSSTKIRKALANGDIKTANQYLGHAYPLTGKVKKGKGLGRKMGFATANIEIAEQYKLIPKNGVYVVRSQIDGKLHHGMMNIGFNPTVNGTKQSIEVHFFELQADLYGKKIQVSLLKRIRDEKKFDSIEQLQTQLEDDRSVSLKITQHAKPDQLFI